MFHAIAWLIVLTLLAVWSALAWVAHALTGWPGWSGGSLAGLSAWIAGWTVPPVLAPWFPPPALDVAKAALAGLAPMLEWVLQILPGLVGWLGPIIVVIWAAGAFVLLLLGAASSLLVRWVDRRSARIG